MNKNKVIIVNTLDCYKGFAYRKNDSYFIITEYYNDAYNLKDVKDYYIEAFGICANNIKYTENKVILNMLYNLPYSEFDKPYNIFNTKLSNNDKIKFELIFNLIK